MIRPAIRLPADEQAEAAAHFESSLKLETDSAEVHAAFAAGATDFTLLDVRSPQLYAQGHVPGAINLPHDEITEGNIARWSADSSFVVYGAGPHCTAAHQAAQRLARLGRRVRIMADGMTGWTDPAEYRGRKALLLRAQRNPPHRGRGDKAKTSDGKKAITGLY